MWCCLVGCMAQGVGSLAVLCLGIHAFVRSHDDVFKLLNNGEDILANSSKLGFESALHDYTAGFFLLFTCLYVGGGGCDGVSTRVCEHKVWRVELDGRVFAAPSVCSHGFASSPMRASTPVPSCTSATSPSPCTC